MRLESTKNIYNNKNNTIISLLRKIDKRVDSEYAELTRIRGSLLRASREKTFLKIRDKLNEAVDKMGHIGTEHTEKSKLLSRISYYIRRNSFHRYAATDQAVIDLCVNFEDFVRRVKLKYYEENVYRLGSKKTVEFEHIVGALNRKYSIHRTLSELVVDESMYGSVDSWLKSLRKDLKMELNFSPSTKEIFLLRNCIVHNQKRVSVYLHEFNKEKYPLRSKIKLTVADVHGFKFSLANSSKKIIKEYNRLYPVNGGTWIDRHHTDD